MLTDLIETKLTDIDLMMFVLDKDARESIYDKWEATTDDSPEYFSSTTLGEAFLSGLDYIFINMAYNSEGYERLASELKLLLIAELMESEE